jgi:hypothetical protein
LDAICSAADAIGDLFHAMRRQPVSRGGGAGKLGNM